MDSKAFARFARIAPRKARTIVNLVRGRKVAEAIDMLLFTRKAAAPVVRKVIESALANARVANPDVDVDTLYVSVGSVDKGPNKHLRRWRPRAMGRATRIEKGVSHIAITLTDQAPVKKSKRVRAPEGENASAESAAVATPSTESQE
jgi:large subunit ribosomal protein L22